MSRVLVIGLDGATFDLIDPWIKEGKLPVLGQCLSEGTRSPLRSTPLSNSAQAWSSFITGKNPGKHGIYDFFERVPDGYGVRFLNASFRKGKSLWRLVSDAGRRVGIMNVPITYPAEPVNGFLIPGLDAPGMDNSFAHPRGLMDEIDQQVGRYILEAGIWGYIRRGRPEAALEKLLEMARVRTATASYLLKTKAWDLFVVVYTATDKAQHHFWKYIDPSRPEFLSTQPYGSAIFQVYQQIDRGIAQLIQSAGDATVIVMSDHGAGPSSRRTMYINRWLQHEGFLRSLGGQRVSGRIGRLKYRLLEGANNHIRKILPRKAKERMLRLLPRLRDRVDSALLLPGIDWSHTLAYSRENHPAIFINLVGREPDGVVEPGDHYLAVRDRIIEKLRGLRCPETGLSIVGEIFRREDVYHGSEALRGPDIIFRWNQSLYVHRPSGPESEGRFLETLEDRAILACENTRRPSGIHRDEGIFIGRGGPIRRGKSIAGITIYDIAPTVLYLLGIPVPDDMDGRVLREAIDEGYVSQNPVRTMTASEGEETAQEEFGSRETEVIQSKLRGLGYID
jgi:predicted AlkP superfamily phosphohydrolase/phosphomutase